MTREMIGKWFITVATRNDKEKSNANLSIPRLTDGNVSSEERKTLEEVVGDTAGCNTAFLIGMTR